MTTSPGTLASVTFGQTENATGYDAAVLQNGNYIQETLLDFTDGTGIDPTACAANPWFARNLLVNGGFDISQRGPGPWDATSVDQCATDGWRVSFGVWSRETVTTDNSQYSLKCVQDGTNRSFMQQGIYEVEQWRGKKVSVSMRVRGASGHLVLWDETAGGDVSNVAYTAEIDASSGWTTFYTTLTVRSTATIIHMSWEATTGIGTFYVDNVMMTCTDGPLPFQPTHPALDLMNAQRRYFTTRFSYSYHSTSGGANNNESWDLPFPSPMLFTPSASIVADGVPADNNNSTALVLSSITLTEIGQIMFNNAGTGQYFNYNMIITVDAGIY